MNTCRCHTPPFDHRDFVKRRIGRDATRGRDGEVSVLTCKHCAAQWLHYFVEYEGFTGSGRWFRTPISDADVATLAPEQAVPFLQRQTWFFEGGSYFQSTGRRASGVVHVDL
ncbi:MAG: hypothetical protein JSR34_12810 [Proteobacteria bacterium]|nr:hypothetical protein [Pseudomonadota bacterium]